MKEKIQKDSEAISFMVRSFFATAMLLFFLSFGVCYGETIKLACEATLQKNRNSQGAFIEAKDIAKWTGTLTIDQDQELASENWQWHDWFDGQWIPRDTVEWRNLLTKITPAVIIIWGEDGTVQKISRESLDFVLYTGAVTVGKCTIIDSHQNTAEGLK
jgi:hypothetical protein